MTTSPARPTGKPIPIPVVAAVGPGSQPEDEALDYLVMPQGMATFQPPLLPEPEDLAGHDGALAVLRAACAALRSAADGGDGAVLALDALNDADRKLLNQVLGEGEVSAQLLDDEGRPQVRIQESVFAGLWRVLDARGHVHLKDTLEIGAIPRCVAETAALDGATPPPPIDTPAGVMNAPSLLHELADHWRDWRAGQPAHVVNLSLLPLAPQDLAHLDAVLGSGRVVVLSRGYGNCRVGSTRLPHTWRVVYYNSQDAVILHSIEVGAVPEVACAAREDLADSAERLHEVLQWIAQE
jgi:hydrogenase-1 operon protein HyaF